MIGPAITDRAFYDRPALELAEALLGKTLAHGDRHGRIVEVEAYIGTDDLACHARSGPNGRARLMFGPPGFAYVYLIYGMYDCFNVVSGPGDFPAAVLVRALEIEGEAKLGSGPGKLCRALAITRRHNGIDLCAGSPLCISDGPPPRRIARTERIGIDYAGAWAKKKWRLVDADSHALSRKLPAR